MNVNKTEDFSVVYCNTIDKYKINSPKIVLNNFIICIVNTLLTMQTSRRWRQSLQTSQSSEVSDNDIQTLWTTQFVAVVTPLLPSRFQILDAWEFERVGENMCLRKLRPSDLPSAIKLMTEKNVLWKVCKVKRKKLFHSFIIWLCEHTKRNMVLKMRLIITTMMVMAIWWWLIKDDV